MSNPFFTFKQFTVWHDKCAMKVGTDGVLLGAWCSLNGRQTVLDVGTGTGLIALLIAQRSEITQIDGIDMDTDAFIQATENVRKSIFHDRIKIIHSSFDSFTPTSTIEYDLIVSNPPYFSAALLGPDTQRNTARHDNTLSLEELVKKSKSLLSPDGSISLILPFDKKEEINRWADFYSLHISRQTTVKPTPASTPKRILTELSMREPKAPEINELVIETARHQYSAEYISLTKEFYLKM